MKSKSFQKQQGPTRSNGFLDKHLFREVTKYTNNAKTWHENDVIRM